MLFSGHVHIVNACKYLRPHESVPDRFVTQRPKKNYLMTSGVRSNSESYSIRRNWYKFTLGRKPETHFIAFYYKAASASGQDESNSVF